MDSTTSGPTNLNSFVSNHYVRSSWIAFFTLWVLWGITYFIRHAFGRTNEVNAAATTTADTDAEATAGTTKRTGWSNVNNSMPDRIDRAHDRLLENTLLLLSVLTLNTFGAGSTRAVMILSWIFFAFTFVYAFTEIGVNHHFIRFVFNTVFFGVTLAIGGLAFYDGWW